MHDQVDVGKLVSPCHTTAGRGRWRASAPPPCRARGWFQETGSTADFIAAPTYLPGRNRTTPFGPLLARAPQPADLRPESPRSPYWRGAFRTSPDLASRVVRIASSISKTLPWRTDATPSKPSAPSAPWIARPCGSSTPSFSVTKTRAFIIAQIRVGALAPGPGRPSAPGRSRSGCRAAAPLPGTPQACRPCRGGSGPCRASRWW